MRTLLVLMFLAACLGVNGQWYQKMTAKMWSDSLYGDQLYGKYSDYVYTKTQAWHYADESERHITVLGSLMESYIHECYNDSTLTHTYSTGYTLLLCHCQVGNLATGYSYELCCKDSSHFTYTHKQPTFEGFYEYLKRKYKTK